jgi:uncharacterized Zn-finger protein
METKHINKTETVQCPYCGKDIRVASKEFNSNTTSRCIYCGKYFYKSLINYMKNYLGV